MHRNNEGRTMLDESIERDIANLKMAIGKDRLAIRIINEDIRENPLSLDLKQAARDIVNLGEDIALKQLKIKRLEQLNAYQKPEDDGEGQF